MVPIIGESFKKLTSKGIPLADINLFFWLPPHLLNGHKRETLVSVTEVIHLPNKMGFLGLSLIGLLKLLTVNLLATAIKLEPLL